MATCANSRDGLAGGAAPSEYGGMLMMMRTGTKKWFNERLFDINTLAAACTVW
jgi:hypothetical protein